MLSYSRPAGMFVGAESGHFTRANATFEATLRDSGTYLVAHVTPMSGGRCSLYLAPPRGVSLTPGTYARAARFPFQSPNTPGMDFACTSGCNILEGSFVLREIQVQATGTVERLHVTFEQSCLRDVAMERTAQLTGELRIMPDR
jgi:hypothetical protein